MKKYKLPIYMSNSKYLTHQVFAKYVLTVREYFELINKSDAIKNLVNIKTTLQIGLTALHRVFEIVLLRSKNVEMAHYYSQKSIYYYSQYMEQISASDLLSTLNHTDAVMFVYKKTICELYDKNSSTKDILCAFDNDTIYISESEIRNIMNNTYRFIHVLFFWDNASFTFDNRYYLSQTLDKYTNDFDLVKNQLPYLEMLHNKAEMSFEKYEEILVELGKTIKKRKGAVDVNKNELLLMKYYGESETFQNKFHDSTTKDLVKWLIV